MTIFVCLQSIMRLMHYTKGRMRLVHLSASQCYSAEVLRSMIEDKLRHSQQLCLDFCGEMIPLCGVEEISLSASLLSAYHNSLVRENIQVSCI